MDASKLRERLRAIVRPGAPDTPGASATGRDDPFAVSAHAAGPPSPGLAVEQSTNHLESALGGEWRSCAGGRCLVVERRVPPDVAHGHDPVIRFAEQIEDALDSASVLVGGVDPRVPLVFFDLETTGLSGGAGTYAFLIGCGSFAEDGAFMTRQYVLARIADERAVLSAFGEELNRAGALISFNGKTFDAPLLETRYLFHRLAFPAAERPHLDMLHPARRFWGNRADGDPPALPSSDGRLNVTSGCAAFERPMASCSLSALERHVLGWRRADDVPGFEIPARYFQFVRSGDARPLAAVLEHNRLDLLSLAGITARLLWLVHRGCGEVRHAPEALALGAVYARAGRLECAEVAFRTAAALSVDGGTSSWVRIEALRALALLARRQRRHGDAARWWDELLALRGCPREVAREAKKALAIHHEHRLRDFEGARSFALQLLDAPARPTWTDAVRLRLARIERKMGLLDL
jgi:uncharacterized protein